MEKIEECFIYGNNNAMHIVSNIFCLSFQHYMAIICQNICTSLQIELMSVWVVAAVAAQIY